MFALPYSFFYSTGVVFFAAWTTIAVSGWLPFF